MKFYIIFSIIFATLIHRSTSGFTGTWQNKVAGIKGTTAYGGIGAVTKTAPTCTATQLAAMDTQIQAELMKYLMTMVVTDVNTFATAYIRQVFTTLEARRAANALIAAGDVNAMVLTPAALMTAFSAFGKDLSTTALQTAIGMIVTNNVDCAVCVPDRARINKVINDYLMGAGEGVLETAIIPAVTMAILTNTFNAVRASGAFPLIDLAAGGYTDVQFTAIRDAIIAQLMNAGNIDIIAKSIIAELKTPLNAAVTSGAIGNLINAAVAMCTTITVAAATPTAFNTNLCAVAAINGGSLVPWQQKIYCLFNSLIG